MIKVSTQSPTVDLVAAAMSFRLRVKVQITTGSYLGHNGYYRSQFSI